MEIGVDFQKTGHSGHSALHSGHFGNALVQLGAAVELLEKSRSEQSMNHIGHSGLVLVKKIAVAVDFQKRSHYEQSAHMGRFVNVVARRLDFDIVLPQVGVRIMIFSRTDLVLEFVEVAVAPYMVIHG